MGTRDEVTRWTLIRRAQGNGADAQAALGELLKRYERTVVQQIRTLQARWRWHPPALEADDLKQELMTEFIRRGDIQKLDPSRGSFRGWLHVVVRNFMLRRLRDSKDNTSGVEVDVVSEPTQELDYIRAFVLDLLKGVLARLDTANASKLRYPALRRFMIGPQMDLVELKPLAKTLDTTEKVLAVEIHRLRAQYKKLLFEAVADTLDLELDPDPDSSPSSPGGAVVAEVQRELCNLYAALTAVAPPEVRVVTSE